MAIFPGMVEEDLLRLSALASSGVPFDEAFKQLVNSPPRDSAQEAYDYFVRYSAGEVD